MLNKQFAIIGIGRFGSSVAETLHKMDYEVLAVDQDPDRVQEIADWVTHVVEADSTDEKALRELGITNFDVVVVAIGEDIQASIMTTLLLKELGVKKVVTRALNAQHGKVLQKIGADKVVFPERDMGVRLVHNLISPSVLDFVELSDDYGMAEIRAGKYFSGKSLQELDIRARFNCNVMAIRSDGKFHITPSVEYMLQEDDLLIVMGHNDDLREMEQKADPDE
jgi:trk system potassium uptake protein